MTVNSIPLILEGFLGEDETINQALRITIKALEEVEQYRALGTVEELKEAREKQISKKPNMEQKDEMGNGIERCPNCLSFGISGYCMECGQKIDWGNEDD